MRYTTNNPFELDRRSFLGRTAAGSVGLLALNYLLQQEALGNTSARKMARARIVPANLPQPKARQVICLFQNGGPSQMDLFDPKPKLAAMNGKPYPGKVETLSAGASGNLMGSPYKFIRSGQCGMEISEILPHTQKIADDITLIRSMVSESVCHEVSLRICHSGNGVSTGRPSIGSWVTYGLGSDNDSLPAFVVLPDPDGLPINGVSNWQSGFLPSIYQGTPFNTGGTPVLNLQTPGSVAAQTRQQQLSFLNELNRAQLAHYPDNTDLAARIENFEIAAHMQTAVPQVVDISRESEHTRKMYGLDRKETRRYGTRLIMARRLIENGVRFVGVYLRGQPWDTHANNAVSTKNTATSVDQPSAALIQDLKQRGLLDSTIVIWMGEFGRTPVSQGSSGRDHSRRGFSIWIAGGGFKRGAVHGTTDDFAYEAQTQVVSIHDLHATLLHALGLNHGRLVFPNDGRDTSLTDPDVTKAKVLPELLA